MKKKIIISSVMLTLLVLCVFPSVSLAADHPLADGETLDISTLAEGDTVTVAAGAHVTITGTNTNIAISCGAGVNLTLSNVNIDDSSASRVCPLTFSGSGNTLNLAEGTANTLKGGNGRAGVTMSGADMELNISGSGTLYSAGGNNSPGIGIGEVGSAGTVSITSGTVFAAYGAAGTKDIDAGDSGTFSISGSAAVFLQHDSCTAPTITDSTHSHYNYNAGTAAVYGVSIPSAWAEAFGAYLRVCTLSYDANGGEGAPSAVTQLYGTTASIASGEGMTHGGYVFTGWNTEADGSGDAYEAGDTYTFEGAELLYAQWDGTDVTVVSSNESLGSVSGGGEYEPGTLVTVTATGKGGYYFAGWYKGSKLVCDTAEYKFTAVDDVTLTARFDKVGMPFNVQCTSYSFNDLYITWAMPEGMYNRASGFEVWRSTSENGKYKNVKTTAKGVHFNNWEDRTLKGATKYYYKVRAFIKSGNKKIYGNYSMTSSGITYLDKVSTIYEPVVTATTVKLTWRGVLGETKYEIWRTDIKDAAPGDYTLAGSTKSKVFTDKGLTTDHTYYYVVVPYRSQDGGRIYAELSRVVEVKPVMGKVTGVKPVRSSPSKVKVSWSGVSGAAKYEIWVSSSADGTYTLLGETSSKYYYDTAAVSGSPRYYKVRAYNTIVITKHYGNHSAPIAMP